MCFVCCQGEESVKERFMLPEDKVVAFMDGEYTLEQALADQEATYTRKGKTMPQVRGGGRSRARARA